MITTLFFSLKSDAAMCYQIAQKMSKIKPAVVKKSDANAGRKLKT